MRTEANIAGNKALKSTEGVPDERSEAEIKAYNLHVELNALLYRYKYLVSKTNSEPTFGEDPAIERAGRALYDNMPLADWEPPK